MPDKAWDSLSADEKVATNRAKKKGDEEGKQFVSQPKKIAKKTSKYRNESLEYRPVKLKSEPSNLNEKLALPKKGEEKQEFISRFMSTELAKKEFPDNKQRVAVAYSQWERKDKLEETVEYKKVRLNEERDSILVKYGVEGYNKPKRTPSHKTKSHVVVAKKGDKTKVIRFGSQGAKGSPKKEGESKEYAQRRKNWVKRHKAQNPKGFKDKFSPLY